MRSAPLLGSIVFFSGGSLIMGFATKQSSVNFKHSSTRKKFNFATPNDSLEVDDRSNTISAGVEKLSPFLPAADPRWACTGPVGKDNFMLNREGGPTAAELSNENILKIVRLECSDLEVNTIVWKCLGYRFDPQTEEWSTSDCFPKWREKHPAPPDFIGMQRIYSPEIDKPSLKANQDLVRSIPIDNKQSLKEHLKPLGFKGYQYSELTPNKTRRAQCANWLIYYREELFGYSIEELQERKRLKLEQEERRQKESTDDDWQPPVAQVY